MPLDWAPNCLCKNSSPVISSERGVEVIMKNKDSVTNRNKVFNSPTVTPAELGETDIPTVTPAPIFNPSFNAETTVEADSASFLVKSQTPFCYSGSSTLVFEQCSTSTVSTDGHAFITKHGSLSNKRARRFKKPKVGSSITPCDPLSASNSSGPEETQRPKKRSRPIIATYPPGFEDSSFNFTHLVSEHGALPVSPLLSSANLGVHIASESITPLPNLAIVDDLAQVVDVDTLGDNLVGSQGFINNIDDEIEATKMVAECLGVKLNGFEQKIKDAIIGDGANHPN
ncbi:hypothetical protein QVD17_17556 [Tagetes erecta]|uniref:Uncharacterized protein n=1 Tax=Tagetes erecta TaxID=13708 RepID=A0AAD8P1K1_TARER|nr:hypothetical protein QVD17_17556 [Tagetes erecta]